MRRVLIFVDGKRSVEELRTLLLADDLQTHAGHTGRGRYIEFHDLTGVGPNSAPPERLPSIAAFGDLPGRRRPDPPAKGPAFMANTLNAYVGTSWVPVRCSIVSSKRTTTAPCVNSTMTGTTPS